MLRLLIDQDLDHVILRGLSLRVSVADIVTAHEVGLSDASDSDLLGWAAEQNRVLVTHDRRTMPFHAAARIASNEDVAGIIVVSRRLPVGDVIDDLEIIVTCSEASEWKNIIMHLPL